MLLRRSELMVFDDLSSALDVNTERTLWDKFRGVSDQTCLVVSHRKAALQMADQVIVMKEGRVVGLGSLDDLLESNQEMRFLYGHELEG